MATALLTALALFTLAAPCGAITPVVRREQPQETAQRQVEFKHSGQLIEMDKEKAESEQDMQDLAELGADSEIDYCNYDFPLGKELTNDCASPHHARIYDMEDCKQAAVQANAGINSDFELTSEWFNLHPEGCFQEECGAFQDGKRAGPNGHGICYFFNRAEITPSAIFKGTPICKRPKLLNGTVNTNGDCSAAGDGGYQEITDEDACREFGTCLGRCIGDGSLYQFRININNASLYNDFPKYCFVHPTDQCVYFNEPREGFTDPTHPRGMPLCNVSKVTHWPTDAA